MMVGLENKMRRQITEKELKIAAKQVRLQVGLIELLINKVRENQVKYNSDLKQTI